MNLEHCAVVAGNLMIGWEGRSIVIEGALLRRRCRCSECRYRELRGAGPENAAGVGVVAASPIGYGLQLHFSDGHNRGVFPWSYLEEIAATDSDGAAATSS